MSDEKRRIRWLCRRGMKELDVLLERFVAVEYDAMDVRQHSEFVNLLDAEDPELWGMVMQRVEPENDIQAGLLAQIRRFERAGGSKP